MSPEATVTVALFTVNDTVPEVLPASVASPAYTAVIGCEPNTSAFVVNVATPLASVPVPKVVTPSRKVTVSPLAGAGLMAAWNVTLLPYVDGLLPAESVSVFVVSNCTVRITFPLATDTQFVVPDATPEPVMVAVALGVPLMLPPLPFPVWISRYVPAPSAVPVALLTVSALLFSVSEAFVTSKAGCAVSPVNAVGVKTSETACVPRLTDPADAPLMSAALVPATGPVPAARKTLLPVRLYALMADTSNVAPAAIAISGVLLMAAVAPSASVPAFRIVLPV